MKKTKHKTEKHRKSRVKTICNKTITDRLWVCGSVQVLQSSYEEPCHVLCQLKSSQLLCNCTINYIWKRLSID